MSLQGSSHSSSTRTPYGTLEMDLPHNRTQEWNPQWTFHYPLEMDSLDGPNECTLINDLRIYLPMDVPAGVSKRTPCNGLH